MRYIVATHNNKKLNELSRILVPLGIEAVTDRDLGLSLPEVEENGATFEENAFLKADSACRATGLPAIADDSGLCVDALDGAPGLYSARFAGEGATDAEKIEKLLTALEDVPEEKRTARFVSAICCVFPDGKTLYARGECEGAIAFAPSGEGGFGYDPVFVTDGNSFAQMTAEEKDAVSHRGRSLRAFSKVLETYLQQGE
ncbi:MAG: RdgB/HAM1 family non-canonical purine NTP pyrophosphatase [Clostridia bacterium]|nr:RdgB/HAM1 family non-canonical purine NTP pyrophosphatase [Clostridia bacterium]